MTLQYPCWRVKCVFYREHEKQRKIRTRVFVSSIQVSLFFSSQQLLSPQFSSVSLPNLMIYHFLLSFKGSCCLPYLYHFNEIGCQPALFVSITRPGLRVFPLFLIMNKTQLARMKVLLQFIFTNVCYMHSSLKRCTCPYKFS